MRKVISLLWIFLLFASITWAQDKIEAPVWNVGDKWVFTQGNIEVVHADQDSYTASFSKDTCSVENKGFEKIIFEKSNLNKMFAFAGDERKQYTAGRKKILNFPLEPGAKWKDKCWDIMLTRDLYGRSANFSETFEVLGWENVVVQAGEFRTIKIEYTMTLIQPPKTPGKAIYWYAPEVRYFVKCQYDKSFYGGATDWELVSFNVKK